MRVRVRARARGPRNPCRPARARRARELRRPAPRRRSPRRPSRSTRANQRRCPNRPTLTRRSRVPRWSPSPVSRTSGRGRSPNSPRCSTGCARVARPESVSTSRSVRRCPTADSTCASRSWGPRAPRWSRRHWPKGRLPYGTCCSAPTGSGTRGPRSWPEGAVRSRRSTSAATGSRPVVPAGSPTSCGPRRRSSPGCGSSATRWAAGEGGRRPNSSRPHGRCAPSTSCRPGSTRPG